MLKDIVIVKPVEPYRLRLVFEDGVEGVANINELITFTGIFEPLKQPDYFRQVRVDRELGTVVWPNGADLDPDVLYSLVTGEPIPTLEMVLA